MVRGSETVNDMNDHDDTDSSNWKLGMLYFNPDDKKIFVPKRYGIGWTVNFARPAAFLFVLVPIIVAVFAALIKR